MSDSILQVNQIKDKGGNAVGITVADSTANVTIGNATLNAGTIGGNVAMASSGVTVRNITQVHLASDQNVTNSNTLTTVFSPTYTPKFANSQIQFVFTYALETRRNNGHDCRKDFRIEVSSANSGFTTVNWGYNDRFIGGYDYGGSGQIVNYHASVMGPLITTTTTGVITAAVKFRNGDAGTDDSITLMANNSAQETYMTWIEYK